MKGDSEVVDEDPLNQEGRLVVFVSLTGLSDAQRLRSVVGSGSVGDLIDLFDTFTLVLLGNASVGSRRMRSLVMPSSRWLLMAGSMWLVTRAAIRRMRS